MYDFPYSFAPKFKKFPTSHCITASEVIFVPFYYLQLLLSCFILFELRKKTPSHLQNHLPNTKLTIIHEWFAMTYFELCKIKIFQADMVAWLPTLEMYCHEYSKDRQTDTNHQLTCTLQQPNSSSRRAQCWRWASTILQTGSWDLRELWCHGKFRTCSFYKKESHSFSLPCCLFLDLSSTSYLEANGRYEHQVLQISHWLGATGRRGINTTWPTRRNSKFSVSKSLTDEGNRRPFRKLA